MQNKDYIYISLGSNLGDKKQNLINALKELKNNNITIYAISPIYETPALLLHNSPTEWNIPYLNCCIKIDTTLNPQDLLILLKTIENQLGHDDLHKWAPRIIDLDILFYKNQIINTINLIIPHQQIANRYFILDALSFIYPEKALELNYYKNKDHQPIFMGILNITPDSFSDGGLHNNEKNFQTTFEFWEKENVAIIDIGAESTKPNAISITFVEELERLAFVFEYLKNRKLNYFQPKLSIDTYHYQTALKAIEYGFDIINDVSGLSDRNMIELAQNYKDKKFVIMHNISIPSNKNIHFLDEQNIILEIEHWLENKLTVLNKYNIKKEQLIFDLGIGFGKTYSQALKLLQNVDYFQKFNIKLLVGHSRKSFINHIISNQKLIDENTLACSLKLANKVDILRVHKPVDSQKALLMYKHLDNQFF